MARKKQAPFRMVAIHVMEDDHGCINVVLPEKVRKNQVLMLRLHHRVVDLLHKNGILEFFTADVEERLAKLAPGILSDFITDLLKEGPKRSQRCGNGP